MIEEGLNKKNKKALLTFMLVLFLFLAVINVLVVSQFRAIMIETQTIEEKYEVNLFANFVTSLVVQKDFAKIVDLVRDWGTARYNIVKIKVVSGNKYILAEYNSDYEIHKPSTVRKNIKVSQGKNYYLSVTYDRIKLEEDLSRITINLIVISITIFIFLSTILWKILVKTALLPLQKEVALIKKHLMNYWLLRKKQTEQIKQNQNF